MRKRLGKLFELWPVYLLACVYYVSWFNPDLVIAPALMMNYKLLAKPFVVLIIGSIGFLEMLGGYKGWSGMRGLVERWLRDDIEFVKQLKGEEKTKDFIGWLKVRLARKYLKYTDNRDYYQEPVSKVWIFRNIDKVFKWFVVILKAGGVVAMFIFGLIPIPGFRVIPDVLCGSARSKMGFIALSLGNFLKTVGMVYGWGEVLG